MKKAHDPELEGCTPDEEEEIGLLTKVQDHDAESMHRQVQRMGQVADMS